MTKPTNADDAAWAAADDELNSLADSLHRQIQEAAARLVASRCANPRASHQRDLAALVGSLMSWREEGRNAAAESERQRTLAEEARAGYVSPTEAAAILADDTAWAAASDARKQDALRRATQWVDEVSDPAPPKGVRLSLGPTGSAPSTLTVDGHTMDLADLNVSAVRVEAVAMEPVTIELTLLLPDAVTVDAPRLAIPREDLAALAEACGYRLADDADGDDADRE